MDSETQNHDEESFEESFERLEKIVEELENGDLGLDESLELYEEGVKLVRRCRNRLEEAEQRLEVLDSGVTEDDDGNLGEESQGKTNEK